MNLLPVAAAHLALPMPGTRKLTLEGLPPRRRLVPVGARASHGPKAKVNSTRVTDVYLHSSRTRTGAAVDKLAEYRRGNRQTETPRNPA